MLFWLLRFFTSANIPCVKPRNTWPKRHHGAAVTKDWIDEVKFNADGLVPVVAQDFQSGRVLMLAWANAEALREACSTGRGVYFSRSRGKLWRKGEESGNVQKLHEIRLDCDGDSVLYVVTQVGGMACHTGRESCFYRRLENDEWHTTDPVIVSPDRLYAKH